VRKILDDHLAAEFYALDTGHFALEDKGTEIALLDARFPASGPVTQSVFDRVEKIRHELITGATGET
jgi:hypothetical protein